MRTTLLLIVFCACLLNGIAQDSPPSDSLSQKKAWVVSGFIKDHEKLWTSPFRMEHKRLYIWVPVIVATAHAITYESEIRDGIKDFQGDHPWVDQVSPVMTLGGDGFTLAGITGGLYLSGLLLKNQKARETGMLSAHALVHAAIVVTIMKQVAARQRPEVDGTDQWHFFPKGLEADGGTKFTSFPSGHTMGAWAVATVISRQYSDKKWVAPVCYSLATAIGLSRVTEDKHWLSDVMVGAVIGYGIGRFISRSRAGTKWTLLPVASKKNVMLTGVYSF